MPSLRSSPWMRGAPQRGLAKLIWQIRRRTLADTEGLPTREGLPAPERSKACAMPADDSSRIDDRKCIENARCDPLKADEYEPIKVAEDRPLARPSTQHIQLVA